jgi:hypothetical protein
MADRKEKRADRSATERRAQVEPVRGFASPPCLMGEVDPAYMGLPPDPAPKRPRRRGKA